MRFGTFVFLVCGVLFAGCAIAYLAWQRPALAGFNGVGGLLQTPSTEAESATADADELATEQPSPGSSASATRTVARATPPKQPVISEELARATATDETAAQTFKPAGVPVTGMDRDTLRRTAGEPTVRVFSLEGGKTVETYVYSRTEPDTNTYARLIDGRVVAVETLPR